MAQSEQQLENQLVQQLTTLGYEKVVIKDEAALLSNLKRQLEKHNQIQLSDKDFKKVLNHLAKGNVFDRAEKLREKFQFHNDEGQAVYIEFINKEHWCQNEYQVTQQVTIEGKYKNRYDVTLLVNGLPLVQIELKKRGLELKEAFNQINRYQRHTFWANSGLFQYVQLFVISNGVNTKYFANNRKQSFKQTFYWADKENKAIARLPAFAEAFLEKCHLSKMICQHIVLHQENKILMVLRPYQYYAVEAIMERVKNSTKNGYIWHTTGSGKTLTSFKASQLIMDMPEVDKVVFVVDRNDLDYQTTQEFNHFKEGSVDGTTNTRALVSQLNDPKNKLIVTTIQKLNTAISKSRYLKDDSPRRDDKIVFIFDECHRSQFGDTHKRIKNFFRNHQLFGFTGTPIFANNAVKNQLGKRTTTELFDKCLHKYVITNAIRDENVLRFSVDYYGGIKLKEEAEKRDIKVSDINTKEFFSSEKYMGKIVDYIIDYHDRKTHQRAFTAIFCVSSVELLQKYYDLFKTKKQKGEHDLRIATIFSYSAQANEDDASADDMIPDSDFDISEAQGIDQHSREKLDEYMADYNAMYGTKYSTKDSQTFYDYYKNIAKRIKERERESFNDKDRVDILLVVNMFLTGFDAKKVNTLYVDKNLKHHGLIQAYSRTNRTMGIVKSHGNIVCFRNLKEATDDAIALFSNKEAIEVIIMEPYQHYVDKFNEAYEHLQTIAPTPDSVHDIMGEEELLEFVRAFRSIMRLQNILSGFAEFEPSDLDIEEDTYVEYRSQYFDIRDATKNRTNKEKVSILDDVDFELELLHRDEINVSYILKLLAKLHGATKTEEQVRQRKAIIDMLGGEEQLRSKRHLIEQFINEYLPNIKDAEDITDEFYLFWDAERYKALHTICEEEGLDKSKLYGILERYVFTGRSPLRTEIVDALLEKPKLLESRKIVARVTERLMEFVQVFDTGFGG